MRIITLKQLRKLIKDLPDDTGLLVTDAFSAHGWINGRPEFSVQMMKGEDSENFPRHSKAKDAKPYLLIKT